MRTAKRVLRRLSNITITFTTDTGEKVSASMDQKDLMKIVGLDAGIHNMSSVMGYIATQKIEKWCEENPPVVTELQKAILKKRIKSFSTYLDVSGNVLEVRTDDGVYETLKFEYETPDDLREDYQYCKTYLLKQK